MAPSVSRRLSTTAVADSVQVQGEAQGSEDALNDFVQHLNTGPSAASVDSVDKSEIATKSGESRFTVQ
jgi:acylphosphatase